MQDECDLTTESYWYKEQIAKKCLQALERNNIKGHYIKDREKALSKLSEMIPQGVTIGIGDSVTLLQIGIVQELEKRENHQILNPFRKDGRSHFPETRREVADIGRKALATDIFLTGVNAITLDGKLVNIDGLGNRAAALIFGPRKVIAVAGANKVVKDFNGALKRIKEVAAPINAKRHHLKHGMEPPPCALTGTCSDCRSPQRICNNIVIVEHQLRPRIEVVLIGEKLGI